MAGLSEAKCAFLAQRLLRACGVGSMALVGDASAGLVTGLRMSCVDVRTFPLQGEQHDPAVTLGDGPVDNVVMITSSLTPDNAAAVGLLQLAGQARRSVALVLLGQAARPDSRADWEQVFISAGLRKHPLLEVVAPYDTLDCAADLMMLLFEPVPAAAATAYPLEVLIAERDLHTDMTREGGRRSDAHMTRYAQAARFVRPGDRILDAACGLGYGSHVLANSSGAASLVGLDASQYAVEYATVNFANGNAKPMAFREGDAEALTFLDDASVDFAVSVETLEHLHRPEALLSELMRVLTPGGRAYLSVPNNWADETGKDPNPFHFHVYDWPLLRGQLTQCGFIVERAWTQDAGGGQRLHHATRAIREFDPEQGPHVDGEWLLALVMKPLRPFERDREADATAPNITAFSRDYLNPWLVRGMVSIGLRATSEGVLSELAVATMENSGEGSADFGAALCVQCYRALDCATTDDKGRLAEQALAYGRMQASNPSVLRWEVSLAYVAGLLYLSEGETARAFGAFERVTGYDVLQYSPLLATKTVAAAFRLGMLSLSKSDADGARKWWWHAVSEARRVVDSRQWREVLGDDPQAPQTFGLPELGAVLLEAARAANGLRALVDAHEQPGLFWQLVQQTPGEVAALQQIELEVLREWASQLQAGKQWIEQHAAAQVENNEELTEAKQWLDAQYRALNVEVSSLKEEKAELATARDWLDGQYHGLLAEVARLKGAVGQLSRLQESHDALGQEVTRLRESNLVLEQSRQWLDGQYHSLTGEVEQLSQANSELVPSLEWHQLQLQSWQAEVARLSAEHQAKIESAQARIRHLEKSVAERAWMRLCAIILPQK